MKTASPFYVGDLVIYKPSERGYALIDGQRLERGKKYRVKEIVLDSYIVVEGYDHPDGGIYWTEFQKAST